MKQRVLLTTITLLVSLIVFGISSIRIQSNIPITKSESTFLKDTTDLSLCRAVKISGKYVFMNSEPVREYEVVYQVKLSGFKSGDTPTKIAGLVIGKAMKMERKDGKPFDAVIIGSTKYDLAIKFK